MDEKTIQNEVICKCCKAKLTFAPGTNTLKCEYCGTENEIVVDQQIQDNASQEQDLESSLSKDENLVEVHTIKCKCCGAETTLQGNVISDKCEFCDAPLTLDMKQTDKKLKPQAIIPFKVEKNKCNDLFKNWVKGLWFKPSNLVESTTHKEQFAGVYIPYWTYDAQGRAWYKGQRGEHYYVEVEENKKERRTNWFRTSGNVSKFFDDILVPASTSLPYSLLDSLEPFNYKEVMGFDPKYLSGFKCETYSIGLKEGFEKAKKTMEDELEDMAKDQIGGDEQKIDFIEYKFFNTTFKHLLLPIWITAFPYKGKVYRVIINGQTGKVVGDCPRSVLKIIAFILGIVGVIGLIIWLLKK